MHRRVRAKIKWVPTEQGGKKRFPIKEYSTASHFLDDDPNQGWSVILKIELNMDNYVSICDFSFLFPERAPQTIIYVGSKFELFESRKVADGEIIEVSE
ncbi:hypothetical protein [Paenibacillus sp. LHD-38]|uniref:hypothetical protein n=1 Tax=Paenibacillus sp. LHD-38 TaxID=3072143 RepID=UPI00280D8DD7|nr:hypothetical protein [Paenibacillus sp. LHD-38]MDQ8738841.1 hypothetical protein [Paenibacillus sp. LHD-38]